MRQGKYWMNPKKAKGHNGSPDGWWYVNKGSIDIHVDPPAPQAYTSAHITLRINRKQLLEYIRRSK